MNEFITTDAELIRDEIITELESSVGGPLYPGDERRMFAEALVAVFVSMYNSLNDAARQKNAPICAGIRTRCTRRARRCCKDRTDVGNDNAAILFIGTRRGKRIDPAGNQSHKRQHPLF